MTRKLPSPIEARLDNGAFVAFHPDVGIDDGVTAEPEWLIGEDLQGFAGIAPARVAGLAREQQFAKKLHAYTLSRGDRANTHVKDPVDLALLIDLGLPDTATLKQAIRATFTRRATHAEPTYLDPPPEAWRAAFTQLAAEVGLRTTTLEAACTEVAAFWKTLAPYVECLRPLASVETCARFIRTHIPGLHMRINHE